ncbi:MAG: hypothetical protein ACE5G8_15075, partial [Anaerolineae bacterium]
MPQPEQTRRALEAKLNVLEAENRLLTERSEEIWLLGLVAEQVHTLNEAPDIIAAVLERIAILKNIPYCACCALEADPSPTITVLDAYAAFREGTAGKDRITLSPPLIDALNAG